MVKKFFVIVLGIVLLSFNMPRLSADENTSQDGDVVDMLVGDIQTVTANGLTRVSVTDPDIADISDAQVDKVSILGKKAGETSLFLWDVDGKRGVKVRVVNEDLSAVKGRVQKVLDEANISGATLEENFDVGKVVVTGEMTKENKDRMEDILGPYSDNLLDLVKVEKSEDLIEVDMQVVEVSTTLVENLGITWANLNNGGGAPTTATSTTPSTTGVTSNGLQLPYNETPPTTNGKIEDFFKIGNFNRAFQLQATVNALLQEGKAKLISKPRLVVVSGKQASFLVGGEIPIQNTTTNATGTSQTTGTSYTQYGVDMTVTPTIRDGKIDLILNVDIRDVDNSSTFSGNTGATVAFITRTASTDLLMDNKQTIALAGFIKYATSETLNEVPILSKIPILGALFRDRNIPGNSNTEMVIILTPTVLTNKKIADTQIVIPTPADKQAYKEFDSKYEHEPLAVWPLPKTAPDNNLQTLLPEMTAYARMVQERISKAISYPQSIMDRSLAGTVKLRMRILKDGSLDSVEVIESSGNVVLDQDALQAAKTAAPFEAFTSGMDQQDLDFTIPIVYNKLTPGGGQVPAEKVIATY